MKNAGPPVFALSPLHAPLVYSPVAFFFVYISNSCKCTRNWWIWEVSWERIITMVGGCVTNLTMATDVLPVHSFINTDLLFFAEPTNTRCTTINCIHTYIRRRSIDRVYNTKCIPHRAVTPRQSFAIRICMLMANVLVNVECTRKLGAISKGTPRWCRKLDEEEESRTG